MRIIVCGGRAYRDVAKLWEALDRLDRERGISLVIDGFSDATSGPYIGADYWGHQWALARGKLTERVRADWKAHGRAAGPIRNRRMRDNHSPDMVVAFPGGAGTADMVKAAEEKGVEVWRVA